MQIFSKMHQNWPLKCNNFNFGWGKSQSLLGSLQHFPVPLVGGELAGCPSPRTSPLPRTLVPRYLFARIRLGQTWELALSLTQILTLNYNKLLIHVNTGVFASRTFRSWEQKVHTWNKSSTEWMVNGSFIPVELLLPGTCSLWTFHSLELLPPWNFCSMELRALSSFILLPGTFAPEDGNLE